MNLIYRGYEISPQHSVIKDGHVVYTAPSEEDAMKWIDAERRRQLAKT